MTPLEDCRTEDILLSTLRAMDLKTAIKKRSTKMILKIKQRRLRAIFLQRAIEKSPKFK